MEEENKTTCEKSSSSGSQDYVLFWQRNLAVCAVGSFSTIVAMTLLLPFLPLYVQQLGVKDQSLIAFWSGIAYGATFFTAALTAPLWGRLSDRYGRKLMLIRASLGMAIAMSLIGMAQNVWELVGLRLIAGLLGGYASGSTILVAAQTPKQNSGWALGVLSAAIMSGNLVGPLIGGILPQYVGIRNTFILSGAVIFVAFLGTCFLLKEKKVTRSMTRSAPLQMQLSRPQKLITLCMFITGFMLMFANMSIEPIITLYVMQFVADPQVTFVSGIVMSAAALGTILSSARLGKLADQFGHWTVLTVCLCLAAILLIPQGLITHAWQLIALRFLMGLALGGLLPCIASIIRHSIPEGSAGKYLGYSVSAQYTGQVLGPLLGGGVVGWVGMRAVFFLTSAILLAGLGINLFVRKKTL